MNQIDENNISTSEIIQKYRKIRNLSISELSKITNIDEHTLIEIERNQRECGYENAKILSDFFEIDIRLLLDEEKIREREKQKYRELLNTDDHLLSMGKRIRKYRILAGYTLTSLANSLDIARSSLVGIENDTQSMSFSKAQTLAKIIKVDVLQISLSKEEKQKIKYKDLLETDDSLLTVGERIRKYRIKLDYTMGTFAEMVDMTTNSIGGVEKDNFNLSYEKAKKIAAALKINVELIYLTKLDKERKKHAELLEKEDKDLSLGEYIKKHRLLKGYTVEEFSNVIGISVAYLNKIENDNYLISQEKAKLISKLLDIKVDLISTNEIDRQRRKFHELLNTDDIFLSVGMRIKKYRILNNYTLKTFADTCDIVDTHLCNIERDRSKASSKLTEKIAALLKIDIALLADNKNISKSTVNIKNQESTDKEKQIQVLQKKHSNLLKLEDSSLSPGQLIKKHRILLGYTLKSLSKEVGITSPYLSEIEKDRHNVSYEYALKIANVLNLDVTVLSKREEEKLQEKYSELLSTDDSLLSIGQRIKKYRIQKGHSLISLANILGITGPYLIELEKNNRILSNEKTLRLADILDIEPQLITPTEEDIKKQRASMAVKHINYQINSQKRTEKIQEFIKLDDSVLSIGERIKKYRILNNFTLKSLAKEVGITYSYLGQIERNKLNLSLNKTSVLAKALNIDAAIISIRDEEKQKQKFSELLQMEDMQLTIGERIKKYRIIKGYTLESFAEKCDITKSHLGKIESNKSIASLKLTKKMARILMINYTDIYISEKETEQRRASYISKISKKKIEKNSNLLNTDDSILTPGECVRKYRIKEGYTLKTLSSMVGISFSNLSEFEMGKRIICDVDGQKLADILNIDVSLVNR